MQQKIDKIFDKLAKSSYVHEAILYIENSDGSFSYSKNYGNKNLDTPMLMASITKLFTTTCILKLLAQNKLSIEDKLSKYFDMDVLKNIHKFKGKDYSFDLTISNLLFQTSGLPDTFAEGKTSILQKAIKEDFSIDFNENLELIKQMQSHFAPNTEDRSYYADINFDLLGEIIKNITNKHLSDVYKEFIFEPLGLKNTYLPTSEKQFIPKIYHNNDLISRPKVIIANGASGGCVTTAKELMIFIKAFFKGNLFNIKIFEKLSLYNKLQITMGPVNYGGGYMQIPLEGLITMFMGKGELLGHSGSTGSFAFYYPHKDIFMVGDLNQMTKQALPIRLVIQLAMSLK